MDKDLFILVWKAVAPEITKYHTYRLEDYIKYNNDNSTDNKVDRFSYGLQLFDRCADRHFAWSIACKYDCQRLVKYLQENPIKMEDIHYDDLIVEIVKNGRVEYIDLVNGFADYISKLRWIPPVGRCEGHINFFRWILNNTNLSVACWNLLNLVDLTYKDIILLDSVKIKYKMTPNVVYTLKHNIGDFDNPYAAYLCALSGDSIEAIMEYNDPSLGTDIAFIKAMVDRRSVGDLEALFAAFKKRGTNFKRDLFLKYALFDGHLDTIKFLVGKKCKVSLPKKKIVPRQRIVYKVNCKNYELDAIKFLYEKYQCILPEWCIFKILKAARYDILDYYYSKELNDVYDKLSKYSYVVWEHMHPDVIKWAYDRNFIKASAYIDIILHNPSYTGDDIVAYFKKYNIKTISKNILIQLFYNPHKFKTIYNYFGVKKMHTAIKKVNELSADIHLEVLFKVESETYKYLSNLILDDLDRCMKNNFYRCRETAICTQYILDH